jgi:hypothetical protein
MCVRVELVDAVAANLTALQRQIHHIEILLMREINTTRRTQIRE